MSGHRVLNVQIIVCFRAADESFDHHLEPRVVRASIFTKFTF